MTLKDLYHNHPCDFWVLMAIFLFCIVFYIAVFFGQGAMKPNDILKEARIDETGTVSAKWEKNLVVVQWEREYFSSYLMPLVGFGIALLTFLYGRIKDSDAKPQKLFLLVAITMLLVCVVLMTVGLGAIRNWWVTSGDPIPTPVIWVDHFVLGPATAALFSGAFLIFLYSIWFHDAN